MRRRTLALGQELEARCFLTADRGFVPVPLGIVESAQPSFVEHSVAAASVAGDQAGNTWRAAMRLGAIDSEKTVRGAGGGNDFADWYRFSIVEEGSFAASLSTSANFDLYLFEKSERTWRLHDHTGGNRASAKQVTSELASGDYYLLVLPKEGQAGEYYVTLTSPANRAPVAAVPVPVTPTTPPIPTSDSPPQFSSTVGYGQVNANAAVAAALGRSAGLSSVSPLGGADNWNLNLIDAPDAWAHGFTGADVLVAVIDSGVDYGHPDLAANIWTNQREIAGDRRDNDGNGYVDDVHGWDFTQNDNTPLDENGHGTHVAGIIAAARNGLGVTGVAPSARILPVRVLDRDGEGAFVAVAAGIRYAADIGADVINLSLGGSANEQVRAALQYAVDKGVVVVMAAGNDGASSPTHPAQYANEVGLAVGAVDTNSALSTFSNRAGAKRLDYVTAPGVRVLGTHLNGGYARMSGTSMAAPHVAGVAALVLSANRQLSPAQVESILIGATTPSTRAAPSSDSIAARSSSAANPTAALISVGLPIENIARADSPKNSSISHSAESPHFFADDHRRSAPNAAELPARGALSDENMKAINGVAEDWSRAVDALWNSLSPIDELLDETFIVWPSRSTIGYVTSA